MARKLDSAEPAGETPRIPEYRHDVTRSLVRVTATWMSTDYQSRFAEAAGVPDEPHAMTTMYLLIQSGPLRPTALSGILGISAAATSRLVETLASAGLVSTRVLTKHKEAAPVRAPPFRSRAIDARPAPLIAA